MSSYIVISSLLEKTKNVDSDIRYMAMNDLMHELSKEQPTHHVMDEMAEKAIVKCVVDRISKETTGEVQNLAVKCLVPLVKRCKESSIIEMVNLITNHLLSSDLNNSKSTTTETSRDIANMALKTIVCELQNTPASTVGAAGKDEEKTVVKVLFPKLVQLLKKDTSERQIDTIDTVTEALHRFGQQISIVDQESQRTIQDLLFSLLNNPRAAVRKRAATGLGNLVIYSNDELFSSLMSGIVTALKSMEAKKDWDKLKTYVGTVGTLCRYSAQRMGTHLNEIFPLLLKYSEVDDDELRESCFQTLETFVLRCPSEITPHITTISQLALKYLSYDPNYEESDSEDGSNGDDADASMSVDGSDEEEEDEEEFEYSDDDDLSWKVRRASSKLLYSVIATRSELLSDLYRTVAPILIKRFKEREESVRIDIMQTFIKLVKQTLVTSGSIARTGSSSPFDGASMTDSGSFKRRKGKNGPVPMDIEEGPRDLLRQLVPNLCKSISKALSSRSKSTATRQTAFILLREVVECLNGGLENHLPQILPSIETSLASSSHKLTTNSNLKIDALNFLKVLFRTHPPSLFADHLKNLVPNIIQAANDKFYKIVGEVLAVCCELVKILRPVGDHGVGQVSEEYVKYLSGIYEVAIQKLQTSDVDLEVKEQALILLGALVSHASDVLPSAAMQSVVLPLLVDRLRNELTRLTTVKVITTIANSPLRRNTSTASYVDLSPVLPDLLVELASHLRKSHRMLRHTSLNALETLVGQYGRALTSSHYESLLSEILYIMNDADFHVVPLAMGLLVQVVHVGSNVSPSLISNVRNDVIPNLVQLIREQPVLVGSGVAKENFLACWRCFGRVGGKIVFDESLTLLTSNVEGVNKQAFSVIAQSVAVLCVTCPRESQATVKSLIDRLSNGKDDHVKYLALLTVGEIGRKHDLSKEEPAIASSILKLIDSSSEEIKHAAAFALGNVTVGQLSLHMPSLVSAVRSATTKKQKYLILIAFKEVIARCAHRGDEDDNKLADGIKQFANDLWTLLFGICAEDIEESTRNVVAECLGKLSLTDPSNLLPHLQKRLADSNPSIRATVVAAIRYTFTDVAHPDYDELLRPLILDFLKLMKDGDLNVRRVSLATLNAAAHNKAHLIRDILAELLPLVYEETNVREDLIRTVEMGPFKHKVDDGLETRKSAYECMYTLLESCLSKLELFTFLSRVIVGADDPASEIKVLCHMMLQKLAYLTPTAVATRLDEIAAPLRKTLETKPKQNAVKQEIEKNAELVKSATRTVVVVHRALFGATSTAGARESSGSINSPASAQQSGTSMNTSSGTKFEDLYKEIRNDNHPLRDVVTQIQNEGATGLGLTTSMGFNTSLTAMELA